VSKPSSTWRDAVGQINAGLDAQVDHGLPPHVQRHAQELARYDDRLELVRAKPAADSPGLTPEFWHVRRSNDGMPDSYMAIHGPSGEYREPDGAMISDLQSRDLWNDDNFRAVRSGYERAEAERLSSEDKRDSARREQIVERVDASQRLVVGF
jgi:hypothetical protein